MASAVTELGFSNFGVHRDRFENSSKYAPLVTEDDRPNDGDEDCKERNQQPLGRRQFALGSWPSEQCDASDRHCNFRDAVDLHPAAMLLDSFGKVLCKTRRRLLAPPYRS